MDIRARKYFKPLIALLTGLIVISACAPRTPVTAQKQAAPVNTLPAPSGLVNDYANLFDAAEKQELESFLVKLRDQANIDFAVVTIETTDGRPIFDYSLALAKEWKVGPKEVSKGGGLLFLLARKDRQWRLQVSRNLEKDLPDEVCKELGEQSLELYKQGFYAEGVVKYVKAIVARLEKRRGFSLKL